MRKGDWLILVDGGPRNILRMVLADVRDILLPFIGGEFVLLLLFVMLTA